MFEVSCLLGEEVKLCLKTATTMGMLGQPAHDSRNRSPTALPPGPTTEPWEMEGPGLGARPDPPKHHQLLRLAKAPGITRNTMADPIDSAL